MWPNKILITEDVVHAQRRYVNMVEINMLCPFLDHLEKRAGSSASMRVVAVASASSFD